MDFKVVYIISIAVTSVGLFSSLVHGDDAVNERLHRHRRDPGDGGAYSSSGTFAWWKIVLVVGGGLAGMEILYCCCKNYLRKQGSNETEKSKVEQAKENHSESLVTINEQTSRHNMRKNNSFVEAMKPQGYSTLRDHSTTNAEFYYPPPTSPGIVPSSYPQKGTFYVDQPPVGYSMQYTHHLISVADKPSTQWGQKMHPLLGASTFV